ncbi:MAG: DUF1800 family protein [Steroidobacteraceae bacterium]
MPAAPRRRFAILLPALASAWLAACGGGGGAGSGGGAPPPPAPSRAEAFRFLTQAGFGATTTDVDEVVRLGYGGWIDAQLAVPATRQLALLRALPQPNTQAERQSAWFATVLDGRDQLRQRMALALGEIFVVSEASGLNQYPQALAYYHDLLADDAFGNFRRLMEDVTLSPEMGYYLSMLGNRRSDAAHHIRPDENYARELMQLFTIGLVQLNPDGSVKTDGGGQPIPTYDQPVVEGFAQVYTGWSFGGSVAFEQPSFDWLQPMQPFEAYHDTGAKMLLDGAVVAAGGSARADLAQALDNVFHHPNVGPFIARQLIQRFVSSNPSAAYVRRVAAAFDDDGHGARGNLGAVLRAVLLDREARDPPAADSQGKVKEPLLRLTALWRAYDAAAANGRYDVAALGTLLGQAPLQSPSVFNFFRPDYAPAGEFAASGRVAPELQIATELTDALTADLFAAAVFQWNRFNAGQDPGAVVADYGRDLVSGDTPAMQVTRVAQRLLGTEPSPSLRAAAETLAAQYPDDQPALRLLEIVHLVATSPEFAVQR